MNFTESFSRDATDRPNGNLASCIVHDLIPLHYLWLNGYPLVPNLEFNGCQHKYALHLSDVCMTGGISLGSEFEKSGRSGGVSCSTPRERSATGAAHG